MQLSPRPLLRDNRALLIFHKDHFFPVDSSLFFEASGALRGFSFPSEFESILEGGSFLAHPSPFQLVLSDVPTM